MALKYYSNRKAKLNMQYKNCKQHIIPFINCKNQINVLEIGCGEGGNLKAFAEKNCICTGIELNPLKAEFAKNAFIDNKNVKIVEANIYDLIENENYFEKFNLVLLVDVIEHVPNHTKLLKCIKSFLKPGGKLFISFPPWFNPFAGHQQATKSKFTKLPWLHLLPKPIYKKYLQLFKEKPEQIAELLDLTKTNLTIKSANNLLKGIFKIEKQQKFLFNPIYKFKFGLKPKRLPNVLQLLPFIAELFTTSYWFLLKK